MTDDLELHRTAALLNQVFDHPNPLTPESLRWYYDENPAGSAAVGRVEEDGKRLGNYALIPNRFRSISGEERILGLGVDLAVDPDARGSGAFRRTVEDSYERGVAQGFDGILGVANANSAPRMVATLGWRSLAPLPVTMIPAIGRTSGFQSTTITKSTVDVVDGLVDGEFEEPRCAPGRSGVCGHRRCCIGVFYGQTTPTASMSPMTSLLFRPAPTSQRFRSESSLGFFSVGQARPYQEGVWPRLLGATTRPRL